ncbi:MAG: NUDIX-like domain-containing protein, partial [Gammaproteobacteria bacterium]
MADARFQPAVIAPATPGGEHYWVAVHDGQVLLLEDDVPLPLPLLRSFGLTGLDAGERHYLGTLDGRHVFAVGLREVPEVTPGLAFVDLRRLLLYPDPVLFAVAGRARQVLEWARDHRWCSRCGQATIAHARDRAMVCTACGYTQYPRV